MKIAYDWRMKVDAAQSAANLSPEEAHAADDLALYTVNNGAIYRDNVKTALAEVARRMVAGNVRMTFHPWQRLAEHGDAAYRAEMKDSPLYRVSNFRRGAVRDAAASQIADHYAEELAEYVARARGLTP